MTLTTTLEQVWPDLTNTVSLVLKARGGLSKELYMTSVQYAACDMPRITNRKISSYCSQPAERSTVNGSGASLCGEKMYLALKLQAEEHCRGVATEISNESDDDARLKVYRERWERYSGSNKAIRYMFSSLDDNWVRPMLATGKPALLVKDMLVDAWYQIVVLNMRDELFDTCNRRILKYRDGDDSVSLADIGAVRLSFGTYGACLSSLQESIDLIPNKRIGLIESYVELLKKATDAYYNAVSQSIQSTSAGNVSTMLRLSREETCSKYILGDIRASVLVQQVDAILIGSKLKYLWSMSKAILASDNRHDLKCLYTLLKRVPPHSNYCQEGGVAPFLETLEALIKEDGLNRTESLKNKLEEQSQTSAMIIPKNFPRIYVETLLETHKRYTDLVKECCNDDQLCHVALQKAHQQFVNENAVVKRFSAEYELTSPELLAQFTDLLLKRTQKKVDWNEVSNELKEALTIFRFIEDKDVFRKYAEKYLSRRLINGNSVGEECEQILLKGLSDECGRDYTSHMEQMFKDMSLAPDINARFRKFLQSFVPKTSSDVADNERFTNEEISTLSDISRTVDAQFLVLKTSCWPFNPPSVPLILPPALSGGMKAFNSFYVSVEKKNTKLTWLHHIGKAVVHLSWNKASSPSSSRPIADDDEFETPTDPATPINPLQGHLLHCSLYQAAILMQYNERDSYSISELEIRTGITQQCLRQYLESIVSEGLLAVQTDDEGTTDLPAVLEPELVIKINSDYNSRRVVINLNVVSKSQQKTEAVATHKSIEQDRKPNIKAAIMRIMKGRKELKHNFLMREVIAQVSPWFHPSVPVIKRCIDQLIEQGYLGRHPDDQSLYMYVVE